jgi:hypothetical protein
MRTSDATFQKVKSLLRRLDSSIDEARERRRVQESDTPGHRPNGRLNGRNPEAQAIHDRLREIGRTDTPATS